MREYHGLKKTPEYNSWVAMKGRCYNNNDSHYHRYGGRGIKVCDRWLNSFINFLDDMGNKPTTKHSLDRIDNDGDYSPDNCRWVTNIEQGNNKSDTVFVEYNGIKKTIRQWSDFTGISYKTLRQRLFIYNWPVGKALTTNVREYSNGKHSN